MSREYREGLLVAQRMANEKAHEYRGSGLHDDVLKALALEEFSTDLLVERQADERVEDETRQRRQAERNR